MNVHTCVTWRNQPIPGTPDFKFVIITEARQDRAALAIKKGKDDEEEKKKKRRR